MSKPLAVYVLLLTFTQACWSESISSIYDLALKNDPVMKAARANLKVGEETENISKSRLLPSLSSSADYTESERNSSASQVYSFISADPFLSRSFSDTQTTSYGISLNQAVFDLPIVIPAALRISLDGREHADDPAALLTAARL